MWSLTDASPERLREVAREIETAGRWASFLTPQEHQVYEVALNHNAKTWSRFLEGKIPCQLHFTGNDDNSIIVSEMDPITLAFRVRYMLWEYRIDNLLSSSDRGHRPPSNEGAQPAAAKVEDAADGEKAGEKKDEDYDEDYDDEDENDMADNNSAGSSEEPLDILVAQSKQEDSEPDNRGRIASVFNSSKMYDTFEHDVEQMKQFQRLKASDEQIHNEQDNDDPSLSSKLSNFGNAREESDRNGVVGNGTDLTAFARTAQFGSANLCLKHLLTTIETKRSELQVTDIELRNLISDVRKNRSKWASEERIGQEELYEACERVVQELRGITEHSTAFLNKVSKREAPNYYDVIKNPMDLNTVMRKLRALQYNSKTEFVDDLNLIWSNCLTYNSDPAHFLRVHAIAMRKKTQALAPLIPDVTIRSRAEVEEEAERLEKESREQLKRRGTEPENGHGSKRKMGVTPAKFTAIEKEPAEEQQASSETTKPTGDEEPSNELSADNDTAPLESTSTTIDSKSKGAEDENNSKAAASGEEDGTDGEADGAISSSEPFDEEEEEYQVPDVESAFWNSATRSRRIQCIIGRQAMFVDNKLQMEAPITVRTPGSMLLFDKTIRGEDLAGQMTGLSLLSTDPGKEPFMIEYEANAGIPQAPNDDNSPWITAPVPKLVDLPPSRYLSRGLLNELTMRNLNEMQVIRRLCAKILYIKDLQSGQLLSQHESGALGAGPGGSQVDYPKVSEPEEDISSRLPGAVEIDATAARSSIRRTVAKIAMQSGFEAAQPRAVDTLAAIAGEYMTKLGETLVANLEAPGSSASFNSILSGTLDLMGVQRLSQLTKYIGDDVLRQGRRLSTFRLRLNSMLIEILRPEVEKYQDEQFNDNSEQFVLGQFSNELGDDYFGFKDLGINEELGVSSIAVPFHLLQQRVAYQDSGIPQRGVRRKLGLDVPEYPPLTVEDVLHLPELVKPAFEKLLIKFPAGAASQEKSAGNGEEAEAGDHEEGENPDKNLVDPNSEYIAQLAAQAAHARAKVPTSGKLVPHKKRFEKAYILQEQPQHPQSQEAAPDSDLEHKSQQQPKDQHLHHSKPQQRPQQDSEKQGGNKQGVSDDISDGDVDAELANEIGPLGFDNDPSMTSNGFAFDDSLPTGSLLLQADEDEDEDMGDTGEDLGFDFIKK